MCLIIQLKGIDSFCAGSLYYFKIMEELLMGNFYLCSSIALQAALSKKAFKVYSFLAMGASNEDRSCFPSKETIAKKCKISLSTVVRATRELCEKGLIKIQKRFWDKRDSGIKVTKPPTSTYCWITRGSK